MRWACWGTRFCCKIDRLFKPDTHFFSSVAIKADIVGTPVFVVHQHRCYSYHAPAVDSLTSETVVEKLHAKVMKDGSFQILQVTNYLLSLYMKSHNFDHAHKLFDEMPVKDVRTWTTLMSGFSRTESTILVLELFREMLMQGVCPNKFTLSCVLKSCSSLCETRLGKEIHGWIVRNEIDLDVVLENSILHLYVKCGAFDYSKRLFELMKATDSTSFNIMLAAYMHIGDLEKSLDLFRSSPYKDAASWNTIIDGLTGNGFEMAALGLLYQMVEHGPAFNEITFSIALNLVSSLSLLELGKEIHSQILKLGIHIDGYIRNSLVHMYSKCGKMGKASTTFEKLPLDFLRPRSSKVPCAQSVAESVSWSSMVSGYVHNGDYEGAIKIFIFMIHEQIEVDKYTLTSIVSACAILEFGQQIHAHIQKIGHKLDAHLGSSLIDMYAKCGSLDDALMIFKQCNDPNVVLWTSMICGSALHGHAREAIGLFECMISEGVAPNDVTFVGVLTACSHGGLPEEGLKYFRLMKEVYSIKPGVEHFTCMVDIYGRAGLLSEVKEFIHENDISHITAVWKSFLSSCQLHNDIEMGKWVSEKLLQLEPLDAGPYVLLSNICATEEEWDKAANARSLMQKRGISKHPGQSWV